MAQEDLFSVKSFLNFDFTVTLCKTDNKKSKLHIVNIVMDFNTTA